MHSYKKIKLLPLFQHTVRSHEIRKINIHNSELSDFVGFCVQFIIIPSSRVSSRRAEVIMSTAAAAALSLYCIFFY